MVELNHIVYIGKQRYAENYRGTTQITAYVKDTQSVITCINCRASSDLKEGLFAC